MADSDNRRHWLLFVGFLVSSVLTVGVGGFGLGVAVLTLLETLSLVSALWALLPYAVATVVLVVVDAALLVGTVVESLRRLSFPRSDRLARLATRAERTVPGLRSLGLSERFEPTPEERRQELKRKYVDGEISEAEFERRVREYVEDPADLATDDPALAAALPDEDATDATTSADEDATADDGPARERNVEVE